MTGEVSNAQLRRMRVLVATRDERFCTSATGVLSRHGYLVESTDRASRIPDLFGRMRPNVVVVDASRSPRALAHVIAVMAAISRPVGLLVVADDDAPWLAGLAPMRKDDPAEMLPSEVERAYARCCNERSSLGAIS